METTLSPSPCSFVASPSELDARADFSGARALEAIGTFGQTAFDVRQGRRNVWVVATVGDRDALALRLGFNTDELERVERAMEIDGSLVLEFTTSLGAMRSKIAVVNADLGIVRCTTSLLPARALIVSGWPNDLYAIGPRPGNVHTSQRGLRTGVVFASSDAPNPFSLFYLQNFSSLTDYFAAVERSPADSVSGRWPELGYAPPGGEG